MARLLEPKLLDLPAGDVTPIADTGLQPQPLRPAPELSIVVPTFNERDNLPVLIDRLRDTLGDIAWEVIVVDDDSPDGTTDLARTIGASDARVRCVRRVGRRGLSGACLEGLLASQAPYAAVMDADLQHDEALLVPMLETLRRGDADLVVGTRYAQGEPPHAMSSVRRWISRLATRIARAFMGPTLSDPMSGFFMLKRSVVEALARKLSTQGFKLLLDIVMTAGKSLRLAELPYRFGARRRGESKLDARVVLDFLELVVSKATYDVISIRFISFCMVGAIGIAVHFVVLTTALQVVALPFAPAQTLATVIAIASNFVLNNAVTYRDQRLVGRDFVTGLLGFYVVSLVGVLSNIGVSNWLFSHEQTWWIAGLAGAVMSVVWNYVVTSLTVWHRR